MIAVVIKAGSFFKIIQVLIVSGFKFLLAPPLSFEFGFSYFQTILSTTIGGIIWVFIFFFLSKIILKFLSKIWPYIKAFFSKSDLKALLTSEIIKKTKVKSKKYFTKKNKFIIMTKRKYGLWGIAILTPVLLSIPLGTFLANKYYRNKKTVLFYLTLSVACWSVITSSIFFLL